MSLNKVKSIISAPKAKPKVKVINNIVFILSYITSISTSILWRIHNSKKVQIAHICFQDIAHSIDLTVSMSKLMSTSHMVTSVSARDSRSVSRVAPLWCSWSRSSPRPPPPSRSSAAGRHCHRIWNNTKLFKMWAAYWSTAGQLRTVTQSLGQLDQVSNTHGI